MNDVWVANRFAPASQIPAVPSGTVLKEFAQGVSMDRRSSRAAQKHEKGTSNNEVEIMRHVEKRTARTCMSGGTPKPQLLETNAFFKNLNT